jgi:hypothetical protein
MKYKLILIFVLVSMNVFSQLRKEYSTPKFAYPPILLLKINPTPAFEVDNMFMFGGELSPPIGKFSFNFDYGIGRGKNNVRKVIRDNFADDKINEMRFEMRAYFSDWYFFNQFDMKPFGRYYAFEYGRKNVESFPEVIIFRGTPDNPRYYEFQKTNITRKEQSFIIKFGRNFIFSRWFMLDVYGGVGAVKYEVTGDESLENQILFYNVTRSKNNWLPNEKGWSPKFTVGVRGVLPLF